MRRSRAAMVVVACCIGAACLIFVLVPSISAAVFPHLRAEGQGSDSVNESDLTAAIVPPTDDERLESLIAGGSVRLLELSVGQIGALHAGNDSLLRSQAAGMVSLAEQLRLDAAALLVSPENESVRSQFIAALDEFAAAGSMLENGIPTDRSVRDDALEHLARGTEVLSETLQGYTPTPTVEPEGSTLPADLAAEADPEFPGALRPGERFIYDDSSGDNTASIIIGGFTLSNGFETIGAKPVEYTPGPGNVYLLVTVQATHLGYRGEGTSSRIRTPAESAFTLYYNGETYRPLQAPGPTSRGGSYSSLVLERHESRAGYLFFEVPEDFDPANAYLQVRVGSNSPVWHLDPAKAAG